MFVNQIILYPMNPRLRSFSQPHETSRKNRSAQASNHARPRPKTMGRGTKAMIRAVRACLGLTHVVQAVRYSTLTRPGKIGWDALKGHQSQMLHLSIDWFKGKITGTSHMSYVMGKSMVSWRFSLKPTH